MRGLFDGEWRWMADVKQAGVGAFGDLGTHGLDVLLWLLGDVDAVTGTIDAGTARYPDCDEVGEAILRFRNGVIATLAGAWDDVANPVQFLISGTEAHASIINDQVWMACPKFQLDGKSPLTPDQLPKGYPHAFELFLDAIEGLDWLFLQEHIMKKIIVISMAIASLSTAALADAQQPIDRAELRPVVGVAIEYLATADERVRGAQHVPGLSRQGVEALQLHVGFGGGALDDAERADDGGGLLLPADLEIAQRALRLGAPIAVVLDFDRTEGVGFGAGLAGHV